MTRLLGMEGCSLNILPTGLHKVLNALDADVIHLHWINNEMISIKEIAKIKKPLVWTLHDRWPLCGAEHHSDAEYWQKTGEGSEARIGDQQFKPEPRSLKSKVSSVIFRQKQKHWRNFRAHFVVPSNWMADQVRKSKLFSEVPVTVIPNGLDLEIFRPMDQAGCRGKFNLPLDKKLILFGAYNPLDSNKGLDLLEQSLLEIPEKLKRQLEVVIFGCPGQRDVGGLKTHWVGAIRGETEMAELYNTGDVVCVPSRRESFGMTALEPLACGVPVVAFRTSGLTDIVDHQRNGYLAQPYDAIDFAEGISWILNEYPMSVLATDSSILSRHARQKAEAMFCQKITARRHLDLYRKLAPAAGRLSLESE